MLRMKSTRFSLFALHAGCLVMAGFSLVSCQTAQIDPEKQATIQALEHYYDGEELERQRDFSAAADSYEKSIEVSPRPRAYYRLAMVNLEMGNVDESKRLLSKAISLSPSYQDARQRLERLESGELPPSAQIDPNSPWAARAGDVEQAQPSGIESVRPIQVQPIQPAVPAMSEEEQALAAEAQEAFRNQDWQKASEYYRELSESQSSDASIQYLAGYSLYQTGQLEEAEIYLVKAVELNPSYSAAWNDLGVVYESLGRSQDAMQAYQNAIEKGAEPGALYNLAVMMEKQAEYKEAIRLYERFIATGETGEFAERAEEQISKLRRYAY